MQVIQHKVLASRATIMSVFTTFSGNLFAFEEVKAILCAASNGALFSPLPQIVSTHLSMSSELMKYPVSTRTSFRKYNCLNRCLINEMLGCENSSMVEL